MNNVLILGATSDIAMAIAHKLAGENYRLQLAARNPSRLEDAAQDLRIRYQTEVQNYAFDATDFENHAAFYQALDPKPDMVVLVFGYLGDQEKGQQSWSEAAQIINVNYTGAVSILNIVAEDFADRRSGVIVGVGSVAGDRGRGSNYLYGSAKAGLAAYLSGLRSRMFKSNVTVVTIKPGFVATSMTEGLDLPPLLTASPNTVAKDVYRSIVKKSGEVYTPWFWRFIMLIIKAIPEFVFKKLKL